MPQAWNIFCHCRTKFGSSRFIGLKSRFISSGRRSCDTLPSKQAVTKLHSIFDPIVAFVIILSDRSGYER